MSFDKIFDLTAGVYFNCYDNPIALDKYELPRTNHLPTLVF